MRLKKIILAVYLVLLARNLWAQQNSTPSHIFTVTPNPAGVTGWIQFQDLQASPYIGGWTAPNTWAADNLLWKFPTNDYEGCMTSDGSLNTAWKNCAHVIAKNLDCPAASASATHYTCATENTFTPATGDMVYFKFDVAPSAGADLAVNSASAKPIVDSMTLAAIAANAASIGSRTWCKYDGTNWQCILGATLPALGAHQVWIGPTPTPKTIPDCADTGGNHLNFTQSTDAWSCGTSGSSTVEHAINFGADNSGTVLATGDIGFYPDVDFTCSTLDRVTISSKQSGTIDIDIWKVNNAIPTSSNKISGTAVHWLNSAQQNLGVSTSNWSAFSLADKDTFGFSIASVTSITAFSARIWCH